MWQQHCLAEAMRKCKKCGRILQKPDEVVVCAKCFWRWDRTGVYTAVEPSQLLLAGEPI